MALRVFVPDKRDTAINEALKELYLLRQAIDYQSGTAGTRLSMVDKIRSKLRSLLDEDSQEK
tara:strand:+ start:4634 stop:4819 length:186 start_codon:yes stop_codon:yes gene_type:complete